MVIEMANKLVLIRHGTTGEGFHGRFVGSTDVPLSREGCSQAARLSYIIQDMGQCTYISSPMKRAVETVRIALRTSIHFDLDPDLREIDFGAFEGLSFEEINSRYPKQVNGWTGLDRDFVFPKGESITDFLVRIRRVGNRMASFETETVVVFTHGGVIRALICYFLGLKPSRYVLFDVDHASVTTIRLFGKKGILAGLNNTSHLRDI